MTVLPWPVRDNSTGNNARTHFTDLTCSLHEHCPRRVMNYDSPHCVCSPLRLYLRGYSGTAGRQSSVATQGAAFSTRDQDNDSCDHCKCALMLTGGKFISTAEQNKKTNYGAVSGNWIYELWNQKGWFLKCCDGVMWPASVLRLIPPIRLVVRCLWFLQPQWDLLHRGPQHQETQRHQMAPLQRPQLLPALHLHDGATLRLLTTPQWQCDPLLLLRSQHLCNILLSWGQSEVVGPKLRLTTHTLETVGSHVGPHLFGPQRGSAHPLSSG